MTSEDCFNATKADEFVPVLCRLRQQLLQIICLDLSPLKGLEFSYFDGLSEFLRGLAERLDCRRALLGSLYIRQDVIQKQRDDRVVNVTTFAFFPVRVV